MKKNMMRIAAAAAMTGVMLGTSGCSMLPIGRALLREMKNTDEPDAPDGQTQPDPACR